MKKQLHPSHTLYSKFRPLPALIIALGSLAATAQETEDDGEVFELSPFTVDASEDMGYYASETLAGGRLSTDIINTGTSIEVITSDFMDDIGANDIQELLQYTTNTEVGGNLGNYVGADVDTSQGDVNDQSSVRNPDANARIRGLAAPDSTRDFFKTNIPFDQYNTERVDINRGSNSFLFGLGSPAGLINSQLAQAQFNDMNRLRFRVGSGGDDPSYRSELDVNREIIKDRLAIRVAGVMNRTEYRQRPNFRDDNRIYGTLKWHPFDNNKMTTLRAHWESGDIRSSTVTTVLPTQNLDSWIDYRVPINVDYNFRYYRQQFGWGAGDVNASPDRFPQIAEIDALRDENGIYGWYPQFQYNSAGNVAKDENGADIFNRPGVSMTNLGGAGYALVFDGTKPGAAYVLQGQFQGLETMALRWGGENTGVLSPQWRRLGKAPDQYWVYTPRAGSGPGDLWWSPSARSAGNASMQFYPNYRNTLENPVGWYKQGYTSLDGFDFSKNALAGDNDYWERDFYNYNFTLEQLFLDGKAGVEVAFDYQNTTREARTFFTGNVEIKLDINQTIPLPQTDASGNILPPQYNDRGEPVVDENGFVVGGARENPNFGRPFIVSRKDASRDRDDKTALRATAFYKLDFEDLAGDDGWLRWLGSHTFSLLGDSYLNEHEAFQATLRSFSDDFNVGEHVHDNSSTTATVAGRQVGMIAYIGPPVQSYLGDSVWDPNTPLSLNQIILQPASYDMRVEDGYSIPMTYWNKGSWPAGAVIGTTDQIDGDEHWAQADLQPRWVPNEGVWIQRTEVKSWAVNAQSFLLNRHLVLNTGYREDFIESWLNRLAPKIGEDQSPVITPDVFRYQDGDYSEIDKGPSGSGTFGYGAVLHWPKNLIKIPESMDIAFHYNFSENFIPDNSRRSIDENIEFVRLSSPQGESTDYGVTFQLFDRKLIVRLNWYENILIGADGSVGNIFNQNLNKMFDAYNNMNKQRVYLDSTDGTVNGAMDGIISNATAIDVERSTVEYTDESGEPAVRDETDLEVIAREWPNWNSMLEARNDLEALLFSGYYQIKENRDRVRSFADGGLNHESINGLTDLEDLKATGFEASITWNPTRSWRMRINVAQQETVKTNISPKLTRFIEEDWLPWVLEHGDIRWGSNPSQPVGTGEIISSNVNENLLEYFTVKSLEGFPSDEVREWRVNMVTNYTFRDGILDGFSVGGSMRWQSESAVGYPLVLKEVIPGTEILVGDVTNPYMGEEEYSFDLSFGYSRRINKVNWQIQLNLRNLQNIDSDEVSVLTAQPDGSPARVRWDPPFQWQVTNTFRW